MPVLGIIFLRHATKHQKLRAVRDLLLAALADERGDCGVRGGKRPRKHGNDLTVHV